MLKQIKMKALKKERKKRKSPDITLYNKEPPKMP